MAKSKKTFRNNNKNEANNKNTKRKNVISSQMKKSTKSKVERLNMEEMISVDDLNALNQESVSKQTKKQNILEAKTLVKAQIKDREILDKIEANKKETNDNMMKQIDLISGFSL